MMKKQNKLLNYLEKYQHLQLSEELIKSQEAML